MCHNDLRCNITVVFLIERVISIIATLMIITRDKMIILLLLLLNMGR